MSDYSESELLDLLHDKIVITNGGTRCDTLDGPCACGAWHSYAEMEHKILSKIETPEAEV